VETVGFAAWKERDGWQIVEGSYMMKGCAEERSSKGLPVRPFVDWPSERRDIVEAIEECFYE
jgi:hypothetical protein